MHKQLQLQSQTNVGKTINWVRQRFIKTINPLHSFPPHKPALRNELNMINYCGTLQFQILKDFAIVA